MRYTSAWRIISNLYIANVITCKHNIFKLCYDYINSGSLQPSLLDSISFKKSAPEKDQNKGSSTSAFKNLIPRVQRNSIEANQESL